jgi:hypothetical protein
VFSAKFQDFSQERIVATLKLPFETNFSSLYADFKHAVVGKKLVEALFLARVLLEHFPIINKINQYDFTLKVLQAENKKYPSLQRHDVFVALAKTCI